MGILGLVKILQKKLLLFSLLCGISSFSLVHAYRVRLVNETQYPVKMHVYNKSIFCGNVHRELQPGESYEEDNGICMVTLVTGEVFVPLTTSRLKGMPEYQQFKVTSYKPPYGRTGTTKDTYALIQQNTSYGQPVFLIVRR